MKRIRHRRSKPASVIGLMIASLTFGACSRSDGEAMDADLPVEAPVTPVGDEKISPAPVQANGPKSGAVSDADTMNGDGSPIILSVLSPAEIQEASLSGELGCSFARKDEGPLLVAMGNVASSDPAFGIVKVADHVEPVAAPGGFDAMIEGATFHGRGKTIRIDPTGEPATGGGESPPLPAMLIYQRADGASRTLQGSWTCGP